MGTRCELQWFSACPERAAQAARAVIADVARLEAKYSRYRPDSLLSRINHIAAQGGAIHVDQETAALLDYAQTCHEQSDGLFDITSGILRQAWRFPSAQSPNIRHATPPEPQRIATLLQRVGWQRLVWSAPELRFPQAGLELDFGGIVKEYAADRAASLAQQYGITSGLIDLGGDIRILGPHPDGSAWHIGIQSPYEQGLLTRVALTHGALASSGDYARCVIIDGIRYGHILNPRTGWPVRHLVAVSVVSELCVLAGSAATIAMLKQQEGATWLDSMGLRHAWVNQYGECGGPLLAVVGERRG